MAGGIYAIFPKAEQCLPPFSLGLYQPLWKCTSVAGGEEI